MTGIDPRLAGVLACPCPHHAAVEADGEALRCQRCSTVFQVRDGIPVMLISEASPGPRGVGGDA